MTEDWEAVGATVAGLREARGWTQLDLSERSGVSIASIRSTERGKGKRSRRTLEDLSKAFGEPKDYLRKKLTGGQAAENADDDAAPNTAALLDLVDALLVRRLKEIVVPYLDGIVRHLNIQPDVMYGTGTTVESGADSVPEASLSKPGKP